MNTQAQKLAQPSLADISMEALHDAWQSLGSDELIVDVRKPEDYGVAHVPGSKNIPFATVIDCSDELAAYRRVYFYCYGGPGSKAIAEQLSAKGFSDLCYVGQTGFSDWQAKGFPVA